MSPATVIFSPAPRDCGGAPLDLDHWPEILADTTLPDGRHLVLGDVDGPHHVWLTDPDPDRPLANIIIRDATIDARREAAWRLERRLTGAAPSRRIGAFRPTPFQRQRLNLLLDILDLTAGSDAPPPSYDVARRLVYRDLKIGRGRDWKSSNERRRTMRLIDQARHLMHGGYRDVLRGIVRG